MDSSEQGPSGVRFITRNELYTIMQQSEDCCLDKKIDYMKNILLNRENYSEQQKQMITDVVKGFKKRIKEKWAAARRKQDVFLKQNKEWLQGSVELPIVGSHLGRPQKPFSELSLRSKRRKTIEARKTFSTDKIKFITQMKLHEMGQRNAAKVLDDITSSPTRATKYLEAYYTSTPREVEQLSPVEALSMFVEAGLSRKQYDIVRSSNPNLYPCYTILQKAKKDCYPPPHSYTVTSTSAEINLQHLMDHTAFRLILTLHNAIEHMNDTDRLTLKLISKWGCDGSQQAQFRMKFEDTSDSDAYIFQSSMVPLRLVYGKDEKTVWQNSVPSSPRYCRPIRIRFIKESAEITREETAYIEEKINMLVQTVIDGPTSICIKHIMLFTMVDAKVCNAITNTTSTMRCYICGATSKDFNNLSLCTKEVNKDALRFGLSILHARIRFFESLLHLSYKIHVKKWQLRSDAEKEIVKHRKMKIQEEFYNQMGIIVDVPKQGFGTTNDGNTSRRFFANAELSASITGLDVNLICRLRTILEVISSGLDINTEKFNTYAMDTAKLYVELYPWHPMTPTMHKILIHGAVVIRHALVPIGQLSEEAAEARNKHLRSYRQNFSRKISRESCNIDVINRLLLTSDPFITSLRRTAHTNRKPFSAEAKNLLLFAPSTCTEESDIDEDNDDEELSMNSDEYFSE